MRGGKREGSGRPKGTKNKRTKKNTAARAKAAELIESVIPDAFEGDAHALLVAVYKDPRHDIDTRKDAAKAALPFERARLSAIAMTGKDGKALTIEALMEAVDGRTRGLPQGG